MTAQFNIDTFKRQYPHANVEAKSHTAVEFKSEDSEYRVYIPGKNDKKSTLTNESFGVLAVKLVQDHIRHFPSLDDHAISTLKFDAFGKMISSVHDLEIDVSEGGKVHIPDKAVSLITDTIELIGALGAVETGGVSEAIAAEVAEDIKIICTVFNVVCTAIDALSDDGGRLNFPAVICHNMNKTAASVYVI